MEDVFGEEWDLDLVDELLRAAEAAHAAKHAAAGGGVGAGPSQEAAAAPPQASAQDLPPPPVAPPRHWTAAPPLQPATPPTAPDEELQHRLAEKDGAISILRSRLAQADQELYQLRKRSFGTPPVGGDGSSASPRFTAAADQIRTPPVDHAKEARRLAAQLAFKDEELLELQHAKLEAEERLATLEHRLEEARSHDAETRSNAASPPKDCPPRQRRRADDGCAALSQEPMGFAVKPGVRSSLPSLHTGVVRGSSDPWMPPWPAWGHDGSPGKGGPLLLQRAPAATAPDERQRAPWQLDNGCTLAGDAVPHGAEQGGPPSVPPPLPAAGTFEYAEVAQALRHIWSPAEEGYTLVDSTGGAAVARRLLACCADELCSLLAEAVEHNKAPPLKGKMAGLAGAPADMTKNLELMRNLRVVVTKVLGGSCNAAALLPPLLGLCESTDVSSRYTLTLQAYKPKRRERRALCATKVLQCLLRFDRESRARMLCPTKTAQTSLCKFTPSYICSREVSAAATSNGPASVLVDHGFGWRMIQDAKRPHLFSANTAPELRLQFTSPRIICKSHNLPACSSLATDENLCKGTEAAQGLRSDATSTCLERLAALLSPSSSAELKEEAISALTILAADSEPLTERQSFRPLLFDGRLARLLSDEEPVELRQQGLRLHHLITTCPRLMAEMCSQEPENLGGQHMLEQLAACLCHVGNHSQDYGLRRAATKMLHFIANAGDQGVEAILTLGLGHADAYVEHSGNDVQAGAEEGGSAARKGAAKGSDVAPVSICQRLLDLVNLELGDAGDSLDPLPGSHSEDRIIGMIGELLELLLLLLSNAAHGMLALEALTGSLRTARRAVGVTTRILAIAANSGSPRFAPMADLAGKLREQVLVAMPARR
eukprot:SM000063S20068  [mRNA]  locus=s63:654807:659712:+ [translate_table: standard]